MDYYDMGAIFLQYDEETAEEEYKLFQDAFKEMQNIGKSERLEAFINERMAQAIPSEMTLEEKIDKLFDVMVPHMAKMLEMSALKDRYEALGTIDELEEVSEKLEETFEKVDTLINVYEAMALEAEDYEAKGWHVVLMDDVIYQQLKDAALESKTMNFVDEQTPRYFYLDGNEEVRELNFIYKVDDE